MGRVHFIGGSPRQLRCAPLPPITTGVKNQGGVRSEGLVS